MLAGFQVRRKSGHLSKVLSAVGVDKSRSRIQALLEKSAETGLACFFDLGLRGRIRLKHFRQRESFSVCQGEGARQREKERERKGERGSAVRGDSLTLAPGDREREQGAVAVGRASGLRAADWPPCHMPAQQTAGELEAALKRTMDTKDVAVACIKIFLMCVTVGECWWQSFWIRPRARRTSQGS